MALIIRPITFTPTAAPTPTRYLPANATVRPISYAAPTPVATDRRPGLTPVEPAEQGTLTQQVIAQRAQETVNRYPSAPFRTYEVSGGYWYGVSTVDNMESRTKLNVATASTSPDPNARYRTSGGTPTFSEGSAGWSQIAASAKPTQPAPGSTKAEYTAYSQALASWEREQLWRSVPESATWNDISDWYSDARFDLPTQERRAYDVLQMALPHYVSAKQQAIEQQYAAQRNVIVSSSGNLVPVNQSYTYVDDSGLYLQQGTRAVDYRNQSTGAMFSAPSVVDLSGKAVTAAGAAVVSGVSAGAKSVLDRGLIGGIAYAKLGQDYLAGGGILGAALKKPVGPPGSGIDFTPVVSGLTGFFQSTPVLAQAYGAGRMVREEGGVLEAYEKWNRETVSPFVKQYVPQPTPEATTVAKNIYPFFSVLQGPGVAVPVISSAVGSVLTRKITGIKYPTMGDIMVEHGVGEVEGIRERPLEAVGMFALTLAIPAATEAGGWAMRSSPTLTRLSQGKYSKYVFGKIPAMSVPETVQGMKLGGGTGLMQGAGKTFNVPIAAIESVMGIMWGQSVIERVTSKPTEKKTVISSSFTPGSQRTYTEGGVTYTETIGPTTQEQYQISTEYNPAIPARLTFKDGKLVWGADLSKMPSQEQMARTTGEITSVEVLPAIGGMVVGQKIVPKVSGYLRSGDTPIDIYDIGYTSAEGYPVSGRITGESLTHSFKKNTFSPWPERMQSGYTEKVTHVPRSARLPTEYEGVYGGWSGMEQDIGRVGSTFVLQRNPSEMAGLYMAPGAEFHFTKVEGQGIADIQLIAGLPVLPQPTMLRTTGVTKFVEVPRTARAKTLSLIKSWRRAHPGQKMPLSAKQEAYKPINFWAQENVETGQAVFPLMKGEYESIIPTFTKSGQTQLQITGRNYYVTDEGVRIPIVEATFTEPHVDFAVVQEGWEIGPAGKPIKAIPEAKPTRLQKVKDTLFGIAEPRVETTPIIKFEPGTGRITQMQVGPIGESRRIAAEELPRSWKQLGGPEGKGTGVEGILGRMGEQDRLATEQLFKVAKGVEGMKAPQEGALDLSKIQSISPQDAPKIERLIAKYKANVYGSTIRLGQMGESRIMEGYGKLPGDLEVKAKDFVGLARDVAKEIGGTTKKNPFGISVYKGGKDVMSANALRGTMPENPFGWMPSEHVKVTIGAGEYAYERLNQQVIRYAYGSLAGREVRGQWKWGPKPHRTEKDIRGFYSDVQYLLETQAEKGKSVKDVASAMREIRKHPQVSEALGGKKYRYGTGFNEYFSGLPLDKYLTSTSGKRGLITEVGISAGIINTLKVPQRETITTGGEVSVKSTRVVEPYTSYLQEPASYISTSQLSKPSSIQGLSGRSTTTKTTPYSRPISGKSGITGTTGITGITGVTGLTGITGVSGRSGITGKSMVSGGSGFSGVSGRSGISGVSGRSGISGVSGRSGISGRSGASGYYSGYSGYYGYTPGTPPPTTPWKPPTKITWTTIWTPRRGRLILEEKRKPKLRTHFDVRGSKWIIKNPIPRPEVVLGGEKGTQYRNELRIYDKQYSKKGYTVHLPFDVIRDYKVTKGLRF